MMVLMHRPIKAGDRSKKKIHTPTEVVFPKRAAGMLVVEVQKNSAVKVLERQGFKVVEKKTVPVKPSVAVEVKSDEEKELYAKTVVELRAMAKEYKIAGRSRMKEKDLVRAIMAARKES